MLSGIWMGGKTVTDVVEELSESMEEANRIKYPLHLGGTALQLFQLAKLRGLGAEPDVAVLKIWEGEDVWFPRTG